MVEPILIHPFDLGAMLMDSTHNDLIILNRVANETVEFGGKVYRLSVDVPAKHTIEEVFGK